MTYPKRHKGWRNITVDGQQFRWRFATHVNGMLSLQGSDSSGEQVIVRLRDWHDPWDLIGHPRLLENEPRVITSKFAAEAILFALAHGWQPERAGQPLYIDYRCKSLELAPNADEGPSTSA